MCSSSDELAKAAFELGKMRGFNNGVESAKKLAHEVAEEVGGKFADTHRLNTGLNLFIRHLEKLKRV